MKNLMTHTLRILFAASFLGFLTGCMPNKTYRANPSVVAVPPPPKLPSPASQLPPSGPCVGPLTEVSAPNPSGPCLAFIEFDDLGEARVKDSIGRAAQLLHAEDLVRAAVLADPIHQPVVLVFIHGWQHNADPGPPEDPNIQGFKVVLNNLYRRDYVGHVVVGISITWRGALISPYWPVAHVLSYFNREQTAYRVGNTSVTDALMRISAIAHPPHTDTDPNQPLLIFIGHSFGGLLLERALSQAFIRQMDEQYEDKKQRAAKAANAAPDTRAPGLSAAQAQADIQNETFTKFADLVVYVNPAGAATESKQVLDYLASHGVTYSSEDTPRLSAQLPLFVSISTPTDAATTTALRAGHTISGLGYKANRGFREKTPITCYNPATNVISRDDSQSQWDFWVKASPHLEAIQSHTVIDYGAPKRAPDVNSCPVLSPGMPGFDAYAREAIPGHCLAIVRRTVNGAPACNGTPYWIMETIPSVLPDHGTIFTDRMINFIGFFLPRADDQGNIPTPQLRFHPMARQPDLFNGPTP